VLVRALGVATEAKHLQALADRYKIIIEQSTRSDS
jgi:hypothetical protein